MAKIEEIEYDSNAEFGNFDDYLSIDVEDNLSSESLRRKICCWCKWREVPREPSYFSDCKTPVSSCKDSDYEAWLADYYENLNHTQNVSICFDKATDTSDIKVEDEIVPRSWVLTQFTNVISEQSTKYWGVKEPRRHWPLAGALKDIHLFPSIYPMLNVSSRYGRFLTNLNTASAVKELEHRKRLCAIFKENLVRAKLFSYQLAKLMLCDNLVVLSWFDLVAKKVVITTFCQFLRNQRYLEKVSFENAQLQQLEGIVLLCALSKNAGDSIKELHIWKMFAYGQCPVLRDTMSVKDQSKSRSLWDVDLTYHFLEILQNFSNLTHLSVNYAYLANREGNALLCFKTVHNGNLKELRLLCLPEERPMCTDPNYGVGGYQIPDGVWKRASELNPRMKVMLVFINIPEYENIILFLSKNIPVASIYVSSGLDFTFRTPWDVDTTLLELHNWYSSTLNTLCLHFWHHRDLLDYVIEYKILDEFPNLLNFEYIGVLKCLTTLENFCKRLLTKKYKLKQLLFWVQEVYSKRRKLKEMREKISEINHLYLQKLQNIDIDAHIKTHPI